MTIVCGPPCSGKSTFVKAHAQPGEPILDWDEVWTEVTGRPVHDLGVQDRAMAEQQTEALFRRRLAEMTEGWVIRTAPRKQHRAIMEQMHQARVIVLAVPEEECLRRLADDPGRGSETAHWIRRWWAEYQPRTAGHELVLR